MKIDQRKRNKKILHVLSAIMELHFILSLCLVIKSPMPKRFYKVESK